MNKVPAEIPGVVEVHDLHDWTITSGFVSLSAHLRIQKNRDAKDILRKTHDAVSTGFKIRHTTGGRGPGLARGSFSAVLARG